jgi:Na+/H+-dicarboxylate symporter
MAAGNMLQIIVFALLVGIALAQVGEPGAAALRFFESINDVNMRMVTILMHLAPWGVFALLTTLFSAEGFGAIIALGKYFFTVVGVLLFHGTVVYPLLLMALTRLNPITLFKNVRPAALFGFSTASSNATLPITLGVVENRLGVNPSIGSFTVPLGATINMDGSAILQGVATVFIAQAYGIDIGLSGYLAVIATATLASIGTAGVPGAALIMLAMVLQQVGLPVEGIALIIGVDRLLDMIRTAVNITGDCVVSTVVAHSEGLLDKSVYNDTSDRDSY